MNSTPHVCVYLVCLLLATGCNKSGTGDTAEFTVSARAGAGGLIAPASATVTRGQSAHFVIAPEAGFVLEQISGCDGVLAGSAYTTASIDETCAITAAFARVDPQPLRLVAQSGSRSVRLSWAGDPATAYRVDLTSDPNCDPSGRSPCADSEHFTAATSPLVVTGLTNGRPYHFTLRTADGTPVARASARPDEWVFDNAVRRIEFGKDGTQYVAGDFRWVGTLSGTAVSFGLPDAAPRVNAPVIAGQVLTIVPDGKRGWYLAGQVEQAGTVHTQVAHVLADGRVNGNFTLSVDGPVHTLTLHQGVLYLGGDFQQVDGHPRRHLAAVDEHARVLSWNPGADRQVHALVADADGLYVAGEFEQVGGAPRARLARITVDGALDVWAPGVDGPVYALTTTEGRILVGGDFTRVAGAERAGFAVFTAGGVLQPDTAHVYGQVRAIAVRDRTIYLGGFFESVEGVARTSLAALNMEGRLLPWDPALADQSLIRAIVPLPDRVYVGGTFIDRAGGVTHGLRAIEPNGRSAVWQASTDAPVTALAAQVRELYAGGAFITATARPRAGLAAIGPDGALSDWRPDLDGVVHTLQTADGVVYAGVRGQRSRVAALDGRSGEVQWTVPVSGGEVGAIELAGGTLYAAGSFTVIGGQARTGLAAIDSAGNLLGWRPHISGVIEALAAPPGGLYVGGRFGAVDGKVRHHLAAFDTTGALLPWAPEVQGHQVLALLTVNDTVFVAGDFTAVDGWQRRNLAAISTSGALLNGPVFGADGRVTSLASDGDILYLGGRFQTLNGAPRNQLGAVAMDGTVVDWSPRIHGAGLTTLHDLTADRHGRVFVGGCFARLGAELRGDYASVPLPSGSRQVPGTLGSG